ncbi:ammonia-forming cytochrome c nitrite reductase subunit c552 [Puteibacter caeruleilacunae]|nr:ammonia-forming cytochrome c nitrite reductase subunit c552 [Puteibacter caeruleilacunae]
MKKIGFIICMLGLFASCTQRQGKPTADAEGYAGSESCIECHQRFYELWAPSHHGLAMQPISAKLLENGMGTLETPLTVEGKSYTPHLEDTTMYIVESDDTTKNKLKVEWALGGKNVIYFLTAIDGGRLQVLPIAYDVNRREWYNNPQSGVRHFPEGGPDEALSWKDRMFTFNTSCYSCHVSQLSNNYDIEKDTYQTSWKESGINCETCHGPSGEHVRVCREAGKDSVPSDLKIIVTSTFTPEQHNNSCAPCHGKVQPLTASYMPGDPFFDNYNLTTLEDRDFYPDGRDLGENYTMTTWYQSPCLTDGKMHCVMCHTSSGRYRFKDDTNKACASCHKDNVENVAEHSHHPVGSEGAKCVSCHMPMTEFARMKRSDHSMKPPAPAATIEFKSPNACNICHEDKTPQWANSKLKEWKKDHHQKKVLEDGRLIQAARSQDWKKLPQILKALNDNKLDQVFTTSLIRLMEGNNRPEVIPTFIAKLKDESALVRSAAAHSLFTYPTEEVKLALMAVANDSLKAVRLGAAYSLSFMPQDMFTATELASLNKLMSEYEESMVCRPDDWGSHYNLGNYHLNRGNVSNAIVSFETAHKLNKHTVEPLINASMAYSYNQDYESAEKSLRKAIAIDSRNEASLFNLGLLLAETNRVEESEQILRKVMDINPKSFAAAYNLAIMVSQRDLKEAVRFSQIAYENGVDNPKYGYTYGFYLIQDGQIVSAEKVLKAVIKANPEMMDAIMLLGTTYEKNNQAGKAKKLYNQALKAFSPGSREYQALKQRL